jgi:hypothetical protein
MKLAAIDANTPTWHPLVIEIAGEIVNISREPQLARDMTCDGCGCDDARACVQGGGPAGPIPCHWVAPFLCSLCAVKGYFAYLGATGRAA